MVNESIFVLAFGFCEYVDPETGLRAIRLLHDLSFGDKNLVVGLSHIQFKNKVGLGNVTVVM